jgi:hypothetical protein
MHVSMPSREKSEQCFVSPSIVMAYCFDASS